MGLRVNRIGHIGIHVSDVDRSIDFYRKVLGLKLTGRWAPPDFVRPICFMRIDDKHHDVVLFELPRDAAKAGVTDSQGRREVGLDHIAFEVDSREDWLHALDHVRSCGVEIVDGPYVHGHEAGHRMSFSGGSGSHAFYFLDPDGNRIEIYCWMMRVTRPSVAAPNPDL
jgi:catechol 2,3-dioxygenase-like lactoylglutathione lyase family enzyme